MSIIINDNKHLPDLIWNKSYFKILNYICWICTNISDNYYYASLSLSATCISKIKYIIATGTSARCRPDAMNEKFRKGDTEWHGISYGAI